MTKLTDFLLVNPLFSPLRLAAWSIVGRALAHRGMVIVPADGDPARASFHALAARVRQETNLVLLDSEAFSVYDAARVTRKVAGAIAEVGVYRGGSARLICEVKGTTEFHLFDTFAGLPATSESDSRFRAGGFASSYDEVTAYLKPYPGLHFHRGLFPDTAAGLEHLRFSFVHIDVDLYDSTKSCLEWFYPRMNPGAIMISHDYRDAEGVRRAFTEFFQDKPECLVELTGSQVLFVKL